MLRKFVLLAILLTGFAIRLWRVGAPLADWHSWRQADTAAVARNFVKEGFDLLHPRFEDLSNVPSGQENPQGWRFVEFPLYNAGQALFFQSAQALGLGFISLEMAGRLVSIFSSLLASIFLYLSVKRLWGWGPGVLSMLFFLFLPYNIYYSRTVLPGPTMLALTLASIYLLMKSQSKCLGTKASWLISLSLAALAILVKPYAIFILIPSWLVIFGGKLWDSNSRRHNILSAAYYILFSILPFLAWRWWMRQFPEGIPANNWLLNMGNIRFRPAWWRWLFAERLGRLILGYWGTLLLGLGIIVKGKWKKDLLFYGWLAGALAYLAVFARGNIQHDYYQIVIIPVVAVFLARGSWFLLRTPSKYFYKVLSLALLMVVFLFMMGFSWYNVRGYYQINHPEIVEAGQAADQLLPPEAKVIAPYSGDTAFLYQTNRPGWPAMTASLEEMIKLGATYYVSVNFDKTTQRVIKNCRVLQRTDKWVIADLQGCKL
jgi:hypothetical protein